MDPFLDLIRLLRPQATLWARIDAAGRWGVSFRQRQDLLFCWVERGGCQLVRLGEAPITLQKDDFALVRTSSPFTLTSDPTLEPENSEDIVAAIGHTGMKLGEGTASPAVLRGGRFVFDTANERLLTELLPQVVHIASSDNSSGRLRALLSMNEAESSSPGLGSEFVVARLMELIFVEVLRNGSPSLNLTQTGLLAGLADPAIALALTEMHHAVAQRWTVASLARLCHLSRSGFSFRFRTVIGIGPIEYLQRWRIALAKDELRRGTRTMGEIALSIGFQSASAFSTAFTRAVGCAPSRFADRSSAEWADQKVSTFL
ncbi:MAG: AraC family transcriptional regulator [Janthinobacterium lividum]